ncbi:LacI family DNA-binding transcriptional regulator [Streptosporangium longisporum]|uniref:LacI family DNA-binding transcriptional regulator n=1 Tax=Streptosporangium longisporum TaxID=46187 RepID=A0ABN3XSJ2_9ACTN
MGNREPKMAAPAVHDVDALAGAGPPRAGEPLTDPGSTRSRPTGRDVARLAGVSQATVSLVFSGIAGHRVSENTRNRVREAAKRLGYQPQAAARQLRLGRTGMVLLAIPDIKGPFFARILAGAHEAAEEHGLTVVVGSQWDSDKLASMTTVNQFDGLLICSPTDRQIGEFPAFMPVIFLDSDPALGGRNRIVVELDVAGGMRSAVRHMVGLGHRRIGHLRYDRPSHTYRARQAAFEEESRHLDVVERLIPEPAGFEGLRKIAWEMLAADDHPRAVICDDDLAAACVYHAAAEFGLRIPDDISVVGIDNIDASAFFVPGLTTVDLSGEELGRLGITAMAGLLNGDDPQAPAPVRTRLVVRQSTEALRM